MSSVDDSVVTIQTSSLSVPSTPSWFGEVALIAHYLRKQGVLSTIAEQVRFARRRFGRYVNADVITRRFRAKNAAFWREKEMTIFFASMAHHFSERASQVVSRESGAALIPLEKHATLAQPLGQNTLKSARNPTGADN